MILTLLGFLLIAVVAYFLGKYLVSLLPIFLLVCLCTPAWGQDLTASWYSVDSLKREGTWEYSKGVMANGKPFSDNNYTCANRLYPLGSILRITNPKNHKSVLVETTDRIGKRFAKTRIDLSKGAFSALADIKQGVIPCIVEVVK